jgi:anti-repressor protein
MDQNIVLQKFSLSLAADLCESVEEFPIDFDMAWQWLGYTRKADAKRALLNAGFVEGIDLRITAQLPTASVPRPGEKISLTVDCLKSWAMMSGTEQGKNVRKYFLDCERVAKSKQSKPRKAWAIPETFEDALLLAGAEMKARKLAEAQSAKLQATVEAQAPAVQFAMAVQASDNTIDMNAYAKSIGTGRTRLFHALREARVIMKNSTLPYQDLIEAGYFEVSQEIDEAGRTVPFALITGKGQLWVKQRLDQRQLLQSKMVAAITGAVQVNLDLDVGDEC